MLCLSFIFAVYIFHTYDMKSCDLFDRFVLTYQSVNIYPRDCMLCIMRVLIGCATISLSVWTHITCCIISG